jgi:hypothetical protein
MTVLSTHYKKHVISVFGACCYYLFDNSIIIDPRSGGMDDFSPPSKRNKQEMQAMRYGDSILLGALADWLSLAAVAFACRPQSTASTLAPAPTATYYIANLRLFPIWIRGDS